MRIASASRGADPLRPQRPAGLGRGAALALVVHGGLLLALALGVSWRASEPTGATAELWAAVPAFAAPAAVAPPPEPLPRPVPVMRPEAKVEPAPPRDAEIAVEKAKREREKEREREREQATKAQAEKNRAKADQDEQRKKLVAADRADKAEQERLEKLRQDTLKRIQGQAGATGGPTATGSAARDAGPSASYAGRIIAKVQPNIVMTGSVAPNLRAVVEVRAAPDGTIVARRLVKSSGNKEWDEAVLRALDRTEVLPRDIDGRVPSPMEIGFTP